MPLVSSPKLTPFELLNVMSERFALSVPADTLMLLIVAAFESMAVVMYGPIETEIPPLAIVPDALVPAKAAVACTKSEPRFEAIAVVSAL
jgi:hypothetical protein